MKKMFLTAIVMLAFSTVSVASNKDEKQTITITVTEIELKSGDLVKYPPGKYDVVCSNGYSFTGYYNGEGSIYGWAGNICTSLAG